MKIMTEEEQFSLPSKSLQNKAKKILDQHLVFHFNPLLVEDIKNSYTETYKKYHNWQHVQDIIASHLKWIGSPQASFVEATIWHDVIYVPGSKNNEKFSSALYAANTPMFQDSKVKRVIEASANHWNRPKDLTEWEHQFLDMDLIGFVENPKINSAKIYQEFKPFFTNDQIVDGRKKFFNMVIHADNFYHTLPKEVSEKAVENIRLELEQLEKVKGTYTFYSYYSWLLNNDEKT